MDQERDEDRHLFLLQALAILRHQVREAERERDEYSIQLQEALHERMAKRAPREAADSGIMSGLSTESEWGDVQMQPLPATSVSPMAEEKEAIG